MTPLMILLFSASQALAADSAPPVPGNSSSTVTVPKGTKHPSHATMTTHPKKHKGPIINGYPPTNTRMPPAGGAVTGGSSASPGGPPTTPYGTSPF